MKGAAKLAEPFAEVRGAIDDLISRATAERPVHALLIGPGAEAATFRITAPDDVEGGVSAAEFRRLFATLNRTRTEEGKLPEINVLIAPSRFEIRLTPPDEPDEAMLLVLARTADEAALLDRTYDELFDESNNPVDINDMDAEARIQVAAEILSTVYPAEHVGKALEDLAAKAARETTSRSATATPRPEASDGLSWPTEKWKGSPEHTGRKQHAIIAYLRRVWKPFIDDNSVIVTREVLKQKDSDAAAALKGYLHYNEIPRDIRIFTDDELRSHLVERPISANRLPALDA
jgi:hypothetical protein